MGEAIDYALPGRGRKKRWWWVIGVVVLGVGLVWFGPGAWREGVFWVTWRVAPWVQAEEGRVVWEKGEVVYRNWALGKALSSGHRGTVLNGLGRELSTFGIAMVRDVTVGSVRHRLVIAVWMSEEDSKGEFCATTSVIELKSGGRVRCVQCRESRLVSASEVWDSSAGGVTRLGDGGASVEVPMDGKVWAGRVDPGDPNRFLVDFELYGKRETYEVRLGVDVEGKVVVETKWLGEK